MYLKRMLCIIVSELSFEIGRISVMRACETKRVALDLYGTPCTAIAKSCRVDTSLKDTKNPSKYKNDSFFNWIKSFIGFNSILIPSVCNITGT